MPPLISRRPSLFAALCLALEEGSNGVYALIAIKCDWISAC